MILGLAVAQDPNYGRNYQQDDGQHVDSRRPTSTTPIPILHWNKQQEHDGTYKTRYNHILLNNNFTFHTVTLKYLKNYY